MSLGDVVSNNQLGDIQTAGVYPPPGGGLAAYVPAPQDPATLASIQQSAATPGAPVFAPPSQASPYAFTPADRATMDQMLNTGRGRASVDPNRQAVATPAATAPALSPADQALATQMQNTGAGPAAIDPNRPAVAPATYPEKVRVEMGRAEQERLSRAATDEKAAAQAVANAPAAINPTKKDERAAVDVAKDAATGKVPEKKTFAEATRAIIAPPPPTAVQITQAAVPPTPSPGPDPRVPEANGMAISPTEAGVLGSMPAPEVLGGSSVSVPVGHQSPFAPLDANTVIKAASKAASKSVDPEILDPIQVAVTKRFGSGVQPQAVLPVKYSNDNSAHDPVPVDAAHPEGTAGLHLAAPDTPTNESRAPAPAANMSVAPKAEKPNEVSRLLHEGAELPKAVGDAEIDANKVAAAASEEHGNLLERQRLEDEAVNARNTKRDRDLLAQEEANSKATAAYKFDPNGHMQDRSFLSKSLMVLAAGLGGAAAGLRGGPNQGLEQINNMISRDIDAQKATYDTMKNRGHDIQNQWSMNMKVDGNEQATRAASHAQALNAFADHADAQAIATKNPAVVARVAIETNKARTLAASYDVGRQDAQAAAAAKAAGGGGKELTRAQVVMELLRSVSKEVGNPLNLNSVQDINDRAEAILRGQGGEGMALTPHEKPKSTAGDKGLEGELFEIEHGALPKAKQLRDMASENGVWDPNKKNEGSGTLLDRGKRGQADVIRSGEVTDLVAGEGKGNRLTNTSEKNAEEQAPGVVSFDPFNTNLRRHEENVRQLEARAAALRQQLHPGEASQAPRSSNATPSGPQR